jgi:ATP-dependent helicase/nuclease subunit B
LNADASVFILPYDRNLLEVAARHIITRQALPDLSRCSILLPDLHSAATLRRLLLTTAEQAGFPALLGPTITTLNDWLVQQAPLTQRTVDSHATRLMLVESLREHPQLYGNGGPWALADSLIVLFDELTRQRIRLPEQLDAFTSQLSQAYQADDQAYDKDALIPLTREAALIHTLWRAWQQQLHQEDCIDTQGAHIQRLASSCERLAPDQQLYLIGFDHFTTAEADWLKTLMARGQAELMLHCETDALRPAPQIPVADTLPHYHDVFQRLQQQLQQTPETLDQDTDNPFSRFFETVFNLQPRLGQDHSDDPLISPLTSNMAERARHFSTTYPDSPLQQRLSLINAANPEQQARAVDVQIRRWLLQGKRRIAIICADLRLSRRLRALLGRAGIELRDQNGWTLSTSRAAAVLERLLQTAEEDYDQQPLLDLLKSPFVLPDWDEQERLTATWRFERDIIQHENIARGLQRYRQHIIWRLRRLDDKQGWAGGNDNPVNRLLDDIEQAVTPLLACVEGPARPAGQFLDALQQAMERLGLYQTLVDDPAGASLLQALQQLRLSLNGRELNLDWLEFRNWLGQTLEQTHFLLPISDTSGPLVQLLTLTDTPLQDFDALLFASADQEHLPTAPTGTPFFNDAVRHELGLELARHHHERALARFRNLLQRAPEIIFSWHRMDGDKPVNASPWLTLLNTFHQLAYGDSLDDPLPLLISHRPESQIFLCDERQTPPLQTPPAPAAAALLPDTVSATRYQRLVDCPYLFFAADCLGLRATESIQLTLEKSDYGQRVHRILQAFHSDVADMPGPFAATITDTNRTEAQACLEAISQAVFASDLEDNAQHRGWLQQWLALIPAYLDWQQQRQLHWQASWLEVEQNTPLAGVADVMLSGRLDRIDTAIDADSRRAIIDYKTGSAPRQEQVEDGEAVQLPFYALLHEQPLQQVEYLQLGKINNRAQARTAALLEGAALALLRDQHAERLQQLFTALRDQQPLPAWGDQQTCNYCDMDGLCRRQIWEQNLEMHNE